MIVFSDCPSPFRAFRGRQAPLWLLSLLVFAWLGTPSAQGQLKFMPGQIKASGFSCSPGGQFPPPNQLQIRYLLRAGEAEPLREDLLSLQKDVSLVMFETNGQNKLEIKTPFCFFSTNGNCIFSEAPLHVATPDGGFSIQGDGFLWNSATSSLYISNRIHTFVRPELLQKRTAPPSAKPDGHAIGGLDISSDRFAYFDNTGIAEYHDQVQVTGTNLSMSAGKLSLLVPRQEKRLRSVTAEREVVLNYCGVRATGGKAAYVVDTEVADLTEHPSWKQAIERREGSGEHLIIDRSNRLVQTIGQAYLKMPGKSLAAMMPSTPGLVEPRPESDTIFGEVRCDRYDFDLATNQAVFFGPVHVRDLERDQVQGRLDCGQLTATYYTGTNNELRTLLADGTFLMQSSDRSLSGDRAFYTATNDLLEITGNPHWKAGAREGTADFVRGHPQKEEMTFLGHGWMRFPMNDAEQAMVAAAGESQKMPQGLKAAGTNMFAEAFADEYTVMPGLATFKGNVRIEHSPMWLTCDHGNVQIPSDGGSTLTTEGGVKFKLLTPKGEELNGIADKVVYTSTVTTAATNTSITLSGHPAYMTNSMGGTNILFSASQVTMDPVHGTLSASADYKVSGSLTNHTDTGLLPTISK